MAWLGVGRGAPSLGSFGSYLTGDVLSGESPQGRDGRGGDGGRTLLSEVQEGGDGFGEHRVPQGQQVNDHLGFLLSASQPHEDGFHPMLHLLLGICGRPQEKDNEVGDRSYFRHPWSREVCPKKGVCRGPTCSPHSFCWHSLLTREPTATTPVSWTSGASCFPSSLSWAPGKGY